MKFIDWELWSDLRQEVKTFHYFFYRFLAQITVSLGLPLTFLCCCHSGSLSKLLVLSSSLSLALVPVVLALCLVLCPCLALSAPVLAPGQTWGAMQAGRGKKEGWGGAGSIRGSKTCQASWPGPHGFHTDRPYSLYKTRQRNIAD